MEQRLPKERVTALEGESSYNRPPAPSDLDSHSALEEIFQVALSSDGWSATCDETKDNALFRPPSTKRKTRLNDDDEADDQPLRRSKRIKKDETTEGDQGGGSSKRVRLRRSAEMKKGNSSKRGQGGSTGAKDRQPLFPKPDRLSSKVARLQLEMRTRPMIHPRVVRSEPGRRLHLDGTMVLVARTWFKLDAREE